MWQSYTNINKGVFRRNQNQSGTIRNHHELSGRFRKRQTRQGDTSLRLEGRLSRESKLGWETRLSRETSLGLEGRLYRKSRLDRESKLNRDISLGWEGGLCRESRLGRETSLGGRAGSTKRTGWTEKTS
jgi:hypothetical protein